MDFITYEIFQTREALIKWAQEVGKSHDFMIVIKKSDAPRNEKKGRVFLVVSEKYRGKAVKFNEEDTFEQQRSKSTGIKNVIICSY